MDYDQLLNGCSEVGRRMLAAGAEIYRTDTMGTITFTWQNDTLSAASADTLDAAA